MLSTIWEYWKTSFSCSVPGIFPPPIQHTYSRNILHQVLGRLSSLWRGCVNGMVSTEGGASQICLYIWMKAWCCNRVFKFPWVIKEIIESTSGLNFCTPSLKHSGWKRFALSFTSRYMPSIQQCPAQSSFLTYICRWWVDRRMDDGWMDGQVDVGKDDWVGK